MKNETNLSPIQLSRKEALTWAKQYLVGQTIYLSGIDITLTFTMKGIKEAINQPHKHYIEKNRAIKGIQNLLESANLVKKEEDISRVEFRYYYFQTIISGERSFIVLRENRFTGITDFYSIVDKIKE